MLTARNIENQTKSNFTYLVQCCMDAKISKAMKKQLDSRQQKFIQEIFIILRVVFTEDDEGLLDKESNK